MFWSIGRIYFLFFSIQNTESNCSIIFLRHFSIIFSWWKIYSFPVRLIYKRFNSCCSFRLFFYFFMIQHDYYSTLKAFIIFFIDRVSFCFFVFYPVSRICMIHHNSYLFYDFNNTTNEHRQTHYLSLNLPTYFDIFFLSDSKSFSITSSASWFIMISMVSLFECIPCSSSLSCLEEIKLFVIVNWIVRSFTTSFKYGLILLRSSSTDSIFLSPLFLYWV